MTDAIRADVLLGRIASELRDLSILTGRIETTLAAADRADGRTGADRQIMQEIDRIRQTQACLASCLDAIASASPTADRISGAVIAESTELASVAERLRTGARFGDVEATDREPEIW